MDIKLQVQSRARVGSERLNEGKEENFPSKNELKMNHISFWALSHLDLMLD